VEIATSSCGWTAAEMNSGSGRTSRIGAIVVHAFTMMIASMTLAMIFHLFCGLFTA
jgi:hypothetical protein